MMMSRRWRWSYSRSAFSPGWGGRRIVGSGAPLALAALLMLLQIFIVARYFPETKQQSLDRIAV